MTRSLSDFHPAGAPAAKNATPAFQPRRQPGAAEEMQAQANAAAIMKGEVVPGVASRGAEAVWPDEGGPSVAGAGRPLSSSERAPLEPYFRRDLSMVRVHTDADSARSAEEMGAKAFTYGNDVAFGPGQFAPHSAAGRELLAHEVTHTAQQAQAGAMSVQMDKKEGKTGIGDAPPAEPFITMNSVGPEDGFALFGANSADLTSADEVLKAIGNPSAPVSIHIHGYSSAEGDPAYNINLSAHRAAAMKKFLLDKLPKDSEIVLFAHGGTTDFGAGERLRGKNRRAGVSLMGPVRSRFHHDFRLLGGGLELKPFDKPADKPLDKPRDDAGDPPFGFPHRFDPTPSPPFGFPHQFDPTPDPSVLDLKLPPSLTPRHLMDFNALHAAVGGRGFGLSQYPDLTSDWDKMYVKYRYTWGLPEDWAARAANSELSGTLKADAARNNPSAIDRANEAWKAQHPNDTTIGPIMSPDLLQYIFPEKKKKGSK
jgi:outer membrane protein OmpA-like peptidoglycan-associated protein